MTTVRRPHLPAWTPGVLVLVLVACLPALAQSPAEAEARAYRVSGWEETALKVAQGDELTVRVRIRPAPEARVRVTLQTRARGSTIWASARSSRTSDRGVALVRLPTKQAFRGTARLVVATQGGRTVSTSRALVVAPRPIETDDPEPSDEPVASPEFETEVVRLVNVARAQPRWCGPTEMFATDPLVWQDQLGSAARAYALRMGTESFYGHFDPAGQGPAERAAAVGYTGYFGGENIAGGAETPAEVVQGWLYSPGHCQNLMQPAFKEIGVGYMLVPGSSWETYWVQMFGAPATQPAREINPRLLTLS